MPPHSSHHHHPLKIVPRELVFPAPLNRVITNILKLHNVSSTPLAYKVKTTAPQRYCVRPNNGVLPPGETIEVQVLLNIVKDAPPNLETKDKFQIQSIVLSGPLGNATDIGEVWAKATPEQITKQKLKSRFTAAKPATVPPPNPTQPENTNTNTSTNTSTLESSPQTVTTTTITTTTAPAPHDEEPAQVSSQLATSQPLSSSLSSLNSSQSINNSQAQLKNSQSPKTSEIFYSQGDFSPPQPINPPQQSSLDRKDSFRESSDQQQQYFTPTITALASKDTKPNIPQTRLDKSHEISQSKLEFQQPTEPPKPTGDYVVDSVANHTQLRKTLEQVATLKSERENVLKDNQKLHEQIKSLTDLLLRAKEESQQTGLRQRVPSTTTSHTPGSPTSIHPSLTTTVASPSVVQIQTQVLLIIVFFFALIGFLLGRFTR